MSRRTDSNTDIKCNIFRAKNENEHFHKKIELLFVISGHIHAFVEENEFLLEKENLLLINSNRSHYIYVDETAMLCRINFSYEMLSTVYEEEYVAFWCNKISNTDPGYIELRNTMREIILLRMKKDPQNGFLLMEKYSSLLDCLSRNYKVNIALQPESESGSDVRRVQEILNYINDNYYEPITLQGIADNMYISASTLSRTFKKATGIKFPDYVNQVRMHYAVDDLLNTNKSVTEIALENGFSSPSSFNRVFKEKYERSPSEYKRVFRAAPVKNDETLTSDDEQNVWKYLDESSVKFTAVTNKTEAAVDLYPGKKNPFKRISTITVSLGAFYLLNNSVVQQQLKKMAQQLNIRYIRMWNIFSPKCMIASSPDAEVLSFEQIDTAIDFLIENQLHPFLDMTNHPETLIKSGAEYFYKKDDSMGFKSLKQWTYFMDKFMEHVVFRYGIDEVSNWYFEFGDYYPNLKQTYYQDSFAYYENDDYEEVFAAASKIIKSYSPGSMVGGPDWVLSGGIPDVRKYADVWERLDIYPDFYSVHIFPGNSKSSQVTQYPVNDDNKPDADFMKRQIQLINRCLTLAELPKLPLIVTESTPVLSNRNALNDHCSRGTHNLQITNIFQEYAEMVCFWVATDRLSMHYASSEILHGGSGLMSKDGIPKPCYYALYFLAKLDGNIVDRGKGYIAVENTTNSIYILCYNHKMIRSDFNYDADEAVNVHNVDSLFKENDPLNVKFMLHGLEPSGDYVVKRHIVNQEFGSIMDEWKRLGYESQMRSNDIEYLKSVCVPRISMEHKVAEEGQIYLEADLKPHEMCLLHVYR